MRALTQPAKADAPNFSRLFFPSIWKGRWYSTTATFWSFFKDGGGRSSRKARNVFSSRGLHEEEWNTRLLLSSTNEDTSGKKKKKSFFFYLILAGKKKGDPSSFQKDVREKLWWWTECVISISSSFVDTRELLFNWAGRLVLFLFSSSRQLQQMDVTFGRSDGKKIYFERKKTRRSISGIFHLSWRRISRIDLSWVGHSYSERPFFPPFVIHPLRR